MFEKEKLVKFVEKFYLNGKVPSAIIEIEDEKIRTIAKTSAGDLRCFIESDNFGLSDAKIGSYSTGTFLKMLSILDKDINLTMQKNSEGVITKMNCVDTKGKKINFATAALDLIDQDGKKGNVKMYDATVRLNQELIDDILKSSAALTTETITFLRKDEGEGVFYCIFNYSETNDDSIELELPAEDVNEDFPIISFPLSYLKDILIVNGKRFNEAFLKISMKGLMCLSFIDSNTTAEYWIVKLQD